MEDRKHSPSKMGFLTLSGLGYDVNFLQSVFRTVLNVNLSDVMTRTAVRNPDGDENVEIRLQKTPECWTEELLRMANILGALAYTPKRGSNH